MFSGGEAFRIDFALRIGISKLLAKRAGAQLQTLIIDEGFGSQDTEGLARLIEGIHMIKNDFKKIIIVSHLSEFKDEFPVHFVVNKTSSGSTVAIQTRM
jgi:exonuclease SbcC